LLVELRKIVPCDYEFAWKELMLISLNFILFENKRIGHARELKILETIIPLTRYQKTRSRIKKKKFVSLHLSPGGHGPHAR
jgi:hypothetical protein